MRPFLLSEAPLRVVPVQESSKQTSTSPKHQRVHTAVFRPFSVRLSQLCVRICRGRVGKPERNDKEKTKPTQSKHVEGHHHHNPMGITVYGRRLPSGWLEVPRPQRAGWTGLDGRLSAEARRGRTAVQRRGPGSPEASGGPGRGREALKEGCGSGGLGLLRTF